MCCPHLFMHTQWYLSIHKPFVFVQLFIVTAYLCLSPVIDRIDSHASIKQAKTNPNHRFLSIFPEFKYKKLVCHSFMTNRVKIGWTEIDMRQVIKHWEKIYRTNASHNKGTIPDPMVAIDVEDEFQNPLKAGLFFEPTDCQACKCVVFRFQLTILIF